MSDSSPETVEIQRLRDELSRLRSERQQLAAALEFHERDRQLLAFEIHDGIVQDMTAAALFLDSAGGHAEFSNPTDRETYAKGLRALRNAVQEARRLIQGLIPVILDERGLVASLERLIERFREDCGLLVRFKAVAPAIRLKPPVEMTILRIVQEGLHNVWKHSQSPQAEVRLEQEGDLLVVSVQDWGIGFRPQDVQKTRYGLTGVKERARLFGGEATITSSPGQGTLVQVRLPWNSGAPTASSPASL
jgi:signal transduction histidine kinase